MAEHAGTWQEVFLRAVHTGESVSNAARRAGIDPRAAAQARHQDPAFDRAVARAQTAARQRRIGALIDALAEGKALVGAAEQAGIALATLKRWRRQDSDLDARVLTAAARGGHRLGGRTQMRPARPLACPGPRCGTATGYDYGCRTTAKTAPILTRRKEQRDEHNA